MTRGIQVGMPIAQELKEILACPKCKGELEFRDAHVLAHFPDNARWEFQAAFRGSLRWSRDRSQFDAWCEGRTGYPLVDAAMRQLRHEGWIHNRVRLVVASFLTKDLGIDWRWGEQWFMRLLIDGDQSEFVAPKVGVPIGVADTKQYEQTSVSVPPNATLVAYTDGLVERRGDQYQNGPVAATFLSGHGPADLRPILRFWNRISYPTWVHLEEATRSDGQAPTRLGSGVSLSEEDQRIFSEGIGAFTAVPAEVLAGSYDFGRHRRLLDLGATEAVSRRSTSSVQHPPQLVVRGSKHHEPRPVHHAQEPPAELLLESA